MLANKLRLKRVAILKDRQDKNLENYEKIIN